METYTLTPSEAARILGVHADTLKRWADDGKVAYWRTPGGWRRFRREDIEALLVGGLGPVDDDEPAAAAVNQ